MALSINSSNQSPSSLANANSSGTGNISVLSGKLTGSPAISGMNVGPIGSATAVPTTTATSTAILSPGGSQLSQSVVSQTTSQPGTTPASTDSTSLVTLDDDAYRFGGSGQFSSISGDTLVDPSTGYGRELGESDDQEASISLSTQLTAGSNPSADPTGNVLNAYSRFFLQSVKESQSEKFQITETFTDYYIFFYGKRPPIYNYTGSLLNDENHKWTNDLMFFYENFLRGTATVQLGAQAFITYDGRLVSGFLLDMNIQQNSDLYKGAVFSFDVLIIDHRQIYFSADITALIANATAAVNARKAQIQAQISQINASIAPGKSTLTALQVTNGAQPASSVNLPGVTAPVTPPSLKVPIAGTD